VDRLTTEELESKIKEFIDVAEKFTEPYRQKIFEVLLTDYLKGMQRAKEPLEKAEAPPTPMPEKFIIPIDVRAVLSQYGVAEESIQKLFLTQGSEIRPIYSIKTTKKSEAQMQVALLTALENALKPSGRFEFSIEDVRQRCISQKVYDSANFATYFKSNSKLFEDLDDKEHVKLSPDGKSELAEAIMAVAV
jgi:hypothetical protein